MTKAWSIFAKWALVGTTGLGLFYFLTASLLSRDFSHSFDQFILLQPWISLLVLSFGIELGLYKLIRGRSEVIGAGGAANGVSMILCCAHHGSDILPILGISAVGVWLTAYQKDFLILGIIINILAILYLGQFLPVARVRIFKYFSVGIAGIILSLGAFSITQDVITQIPVATSEQTTTLEPQTKEAGVVEVEVAPKQVSPGEEVIFSLLLNNHSIDLNYDYAKITVLVDSEGKVYKPLSWKGGVGGHHVSGDLVFGSLSPKAKSVRLSIAGIDNQNISFDWKL